MGPILVVEDDSDTRHALGELLTVLFPGSRVLMAESGEAALELIRRTRPRVVILDLHLGGIQGFDFASRVAAMSAGRPPAIVALTGDASPDTVGRAEAAGFAAFLRKPADADTLETATHRDWQWVLGVNLWGVIHGVEAFVPRMIARGEPAHIVNTASMAGLIASKGLGVYNTSKYAVVGLSETLVKDLKPHRIGVSVLCPLGVETRIRDSERSRPAALRNERAERAEPMQLIGRHLSPETVADMVLAAIHANELYVITHDESLEPLRRRFERMERSILDRRR